MPLNSPNPVCACQSGTSEHLSQSKSVKLTVKEGERKQADLTVLKLQEGR